MSLTSRYLGRVINTTTVSDTPPVHLVISDTWPSLLRVSDNNEMQIVSQTYVKEGKKIVFEPGDIEVCGMKS